MRHSAATIKLFPAPDPVPCIINALAMPLLEKKIPSLLQDWGLINEINPHRILTPKTVREHPCRSSGSPTSSAFPTGSGQWRSLTEVNDHASCAAGITAAGP